MAKLDDLITELRKPEYAQRVNDADAQALVDDLATPQGAPVWSDASAGDVIDTVRESFAGWDVVALAEFQAVVSNGRVALGDVSVRAALSLTGGDAQRLANEFSRTPTKAESLGLGVVSLALVQEALAAILRVPFRKLELEAEIASRFDRLTLRATSPSNLNTIRDLLGR